ncbi:hypothetical protein ACFL1D_01530 [Candidatus Omnitrophota bacterium]
MDEWWSTYRLNGKMIFVLPRVEYRIRNSAIVHKKVSIYQEQPFIVTLEEPSDFNSRNVLLPLPRRLAVFQKNFKNGVIYVDAPASSAAGPNPLEYPLLNLVLSEILHSKKGIIFHACGVVKNNQCYLFLGHSGDGKSTMAKLWDGQAVILNDDRVALKKNRKSFLAYPIPGYFGNFNSHNVMGGIKISKIFFLQKNDKNKAVPLNNIKALSMLISYTPEVTWDNIIFRENINLLKQIAQNIPCYSLQFYPDKRIVKFIEDLDK